VQLEARKEMKVCGFAFADLNRPGSIQTSLGLAAPMKVFGHNDH
jgi:hypothetical protein